MTEDKGDDLPRVGSLCTGIRGLDIATERHFGGEPAWFSEVEAAPISVVERECPGVPNLGDLTAVDWSAVEPVDILTAGYPCQPFSHAGKRKGASDVRHLWPSVAAAVRHLRPRIVVLENVAGHLSLGFGTVLGDLAEAGFDAEWCLLRASDVGAPHRRERLFVVATNSDHRRRERRRSGDPAVEGRGWEGRQRWPTGAGADVATDASDLGHERRGSARRRGTGPTDGRDALTDTASTARRGAERDRLGPPAGRASESRERPSTSAWGPFAAAIHRWERILGRPAPRPTDDMGRLNPPFVEWMMGYPEGWTAELNRTAALKALGNAVVPQQAAAALSVLAPVVEVAA